MSRYLILIFFSFLIIYQSSSLAQDSTIVRDFELWTGVNVKKSFLDKKLKLGLTQEFRFNENSTRIDNYFTELEANYEVYKNITVGGGYRFIRNQKKNGYVNEGRFYGDLGYSHKIERLKLEYRFRYQNQLEYGAKDDETVNPSSKLRLKLEASYNIKKWKLDPYIAIEGFYAMETNAIIYVDPFVETERVSGFEKMRFTLGTDYKITDLISVGAFYRIEKELKSYPLFYNSPGTYFIGGFNLTFKL